MQWWGPSHDIEFTHEGDKLRIRAISLSQPGDFAVACVMAIAAPLVLVWPRSLLAAFGIACCSGLFFYKYFHETVAILTVTQQYLSSTAHSERVYWRQIKGIEFRHGGDNEASGLYARTGRWSSGTILLPNISREICQKVVTAIFERFPFVEMADDNDGGIFEGLHQLFKSKK